MIEFRARERRSRQSILLLGDSHIHAIKDALEAREHRPTNVAIQARRLFKLKKATGEPINETKQSFPDWLRSARSLFKEQSERGTIEFGDISFEEGMRIARKLRPDDLLVSVIGGNQHAVFSTIQHPQPFDFFLPGDTAPADSRGELVPFRSLYEYFRSSLRRGDGEMIAALRRSTKARVVHLLAPPPKRKNNWIEHYHDTFFATEGIGQLGISKPELRMKFWRLQSRALNEIGGELDVEVMGPPGAACDADGFLARDCYAGDATHANAKYGELVLQQLEERFAIPGRVQAGS